MAITGLQVDLNKLNSNDKDFRYMCMSDLHNELQKDNFKVDGETEKRITTAILKQLEDQSADVSGLAYKCLGPLLRRVSAANVDVVVDTLVTKLAGTGSKSKDPQMREVGTLGLKTAVADVAPGAAAQTLVVRLTPKLVDAINKQGVPPEAITDGLDILHDLLARFASLVPPSDHEQLQQALLAQLDAGKPTARKRATQCVAALGGCLSDDTFNALASTVVQRLSSASSPDLVRTYAQAAGALARAAGPRFGKFLKDCVPVVASFCQKAAGSGDSELLEFSLQALEACALRCPADAAPFLDDVLKTALQFVKYDPNFSDSMDEDADDMERDDDDDDYGDDYSDDEDMSWKIRRAACKVLSAIISTRPDLIPHLYKAAMPQLIARFGEREESVRLDVFAVAADLAKSTAAAASEGKFGVGASGLREALPPLVAGVVKQLNGKSSKTKIAAFSLLSDVVEALHGGMDQHLATVAPGVQKSLQEKGQQASALRAEALAFLKRALAAHPAPVFRPLLPQLLPAVLATVEDRYYKVSAEALRVCSELVRVIRSSAEEPVGDRAALVPPLFSAVLARLQATEQDQEVKEAAIACMGHVIAALGDAGNVNVSAALSVLLDRLQNEITRQTAAKAFALIAASKLPLNLRDALDPATSELTGHLRKSSRTLRHAALDALDAIMCRHGGELSLQVTSAAVAEASALVTDADLQLASLALSFTGHAISAKPAVANTVVEKTLPSAVQLVSSALVQGTPLSRQMGRFFSVLVATKVDGASFEALFAKLMEAGRSSLPSASGRYTGHAAAYSVGAITAAAGPAVVTKTVSQLMGDLQKTGAAAAVKGSTFSLLCIGEIGRRADLGSVAGLQGVLQAAFDSPSEEVKTAGSFALGNVAIGAIGSYLPYILKAIQEQPKQQCSLLHALKQVLIPPPADEQRAPLGDAEIQGVLKLLLTHMESGEDGVRSVVAECLGCLVQTHPAVTVPALQQRTSAPGAPARATACHAVRAALTDRVTATDAALDPVLPAFLGLLADPQPPVRHAAVLLVSATVHHKLPLVRGRLPGLLPLLHEQTVIRQELIRLVDLGPFKVQQDDGLELRKAAFECVDSLLEVVPKALDPAALAATLKTGLGDQYDVKITAHSILSRTCAAAPAVVVQELDAVVEQLEKTLTEKLKQDAVKQDVDRQKEMVRSALRAVHSIEGIADSAKNQHFATFIAKVVKTGPMEQAYLAVKAELTEGSAAA